MNLLLLSLGKPFAAHFCKHIVKTKRLSLNCLDDAVGPMDLTPNALHLALDERGHLVADAGRFERRVGKWQDPDDSQMVPSKSEVGRGRDDMSGFEQQLPSRPKSACARVSRPSIVGVPVKDVIGWGGQAYEAETLVT